MKCGIFLPIPMTSRTRSNLSRTSFLLDELGLLTRPRTWVNAGGMNRFGGLIAGAQRGAGQCDWDCNAGCRGGSGGGL